jgi:hypothetical protein
VTLLEPLTKEPFEKGATPFSGTERRPRRMTSASRLRLSLGMAYLPIELLLRDITRTTARAGVRLEGQVELYRRWRDSRVLKEGSS